MNLKEHAKKLKQDIPTLFLCLKDPQTPLAAKLLAAITVGYALSPIDLVPDFIPLLGYLDDVILLPTLIALTVRLIPQSVWQQNVARSVGMWTNGKPKQWYYAIPIILIWILILCIILKLLF